MVNFFNSLPKDGRVSSAAKSSPAKITQPKKKVPKKKPVDRVGKSSTALGEDWIKKQESLEKDTKKKVETKRPPHKKEDTKRPKREKDHHVSGTGLTKANKKGGRGKGNWGDATAKVDIVEAKKEAKGEKVEVVEEVKPEVVEKKEEAKPEPKIRSLDEFEQAQRTIKPKHKKRKVESSLTVSAATKKETGNEFASLMKKKKAPKSKTSQPKVADITAHVLDVDAQPRRGPKKPSRKDGGKKFQGPRKDQPKKPRTPPKKE
ncbi:hypothetical protein ADUPG1_007064 [Aduncisulcus paluster]|uniref:Hyaluronan/mRNA-binding protein domain-containing protein n=1 Tax=Aduncisulcus paluster TaxID=2918883 RepID=A0ABQ5KQ32_9EUKA|nr:hypothetical protein ADUPG1_007064 [Aduncisulcus paluster]